MAFLLENLTFVHGTSLCLAGPVGSKRTVDKRKFFWDNDFVDVVRVKQEVEVASPVEEIVREDDKPSNDLLQFLAQW